MTTEPALIVTCCHRVIKPKVAQGYTKSKYRCKECGLAADMKTETVTAVTRVINDHPQLTTDGGVSMPMLLAILTGPLMKHVKQGTA